MYCPANPEPFRIWQATSAPVRKLANAFGLRVKASAYLRRIAELEQSGEFERAQRVRANYARAYPAQQAT